MSSNVVNIDSSLAGLGLGIFVFFGILVIAWFVMVILLYVFSSLALYRFMKNRNLDNAFLAWIPIASAYAVGKVYDDINEKQGKKTNFSIILLIVSCAQLVISPISSNSIIIDLISSLGSVGLFIAIIVLELVCYNTIFKTYAPNNSSYFALTLIFTIIPIIPFIPGLCLLKASKNQPVSESRMDN